MKDIFEELEAEVDQNVVNIKHDEIERKNLLIANDNLIVDCLSKEVFYIATNYELTVSRFTEMHEAHTILKYQNLKESFGNDPSPPARDTPDFDSVFIIKKMKASIQGKDNAIKKLRTQISQLKETRSEADLTLDFRTLDFQITQLTEKVSVLQEKNKLFRAENEKVKQHYKELYAIDVELILPHFTGVNCCTNASGSQPRSNTKKNRISPAKGVNKKKVDEHPRINKSILRNTNRVDSSSSSKRTVVQIVLWYLDSGCSKHMTGDHSRLRNFVKKFIWTVRFWNDHFGAIMGYGDYVIGDSVISRVYYVEGLGHNMFSVGQFCDSDLEVAFRKHLCGYTCEIIMADMNILANDVAAKQAPAIAPPTGRMIKFYRPANGCPSARGLHNILYDSGYLHSTVLEHHVFNSSTGLYSCQLDEQWFKLHKDILRDALDITPPNATILLWLRLQVILLLRKSWNMTGKEHLCASDSLGITHRSTSTIALKDMDAPYYNSYLEHVTEYQRYLNEEHDKAGDKSLEPASSQPPKPTPTPTESSKKDQGPARRVVIKEPDSGRIQTLPEVQGKEKEKVAGKQAAYDLLTLQTPKPKNPADQFIFQRRTPMPTESSEHAHSPSLDAELALTDSEKESEEEVPVIKAGDQDEAQAGLNPGEQDEGQAGSNPGNDAESQPQPSHVVHAGPNLEHMDLETIDALTQQKPEQMDEEFTTTAYPNVQENLKLLTED
ncbi:hypothetical protein Tco_0679823 [Tanacetum coccineum]|uniref:Retrovirus-related Pol polyprotein from transposon TNT 1-94-like beta-barrel domain-containing protein n=1 Tax=Tanacetum coccineum TaxID=301880 RepID=A0ABQ4XIX0_9ASTR